MSEDIEWIKEQDRTVSYLIGYSDGLRGHPVYRVGLSEAYHMGYEDAVGDKEMDDTRT